MDSSLRVNILINSRMSLDFIHKESKTMKGIVCNRILKSKIIPAQDDRVSLIDF